MKVLAVLFALETVSAFGRFLRSDAGIVAQWRKAVDDPDWVTIYRLAGVIDLAFAAWFFLVVWR